MSKARDKDGYGLLLGDIAQMLAAARQLSARAVNALMTATYWQVGRRIVEFEQGGKERAAYGEQLLRRLSADLTARVGRGYSRQNLQQFRLFYLAYDIDRICQTLSGKLAERGGIARQCRANLCGQKFGGSFLPNQGHKIEYDELDASKTKEIIDEIDRVLAAHYGFTDEELDFIPSTKLGRHPFGSAQGGQLRHQVPDGTRHGERRGMNDRAGERLSVWF